MKKVILFLIIAMTIFIVGNDVYAEDYKFYEAEYIDNIYMNKYDYSSNTIYYQKARKFRNQRTSQEVYCIEPLTFFNESSTYQTTTTPRNLTQKQINRIKKIAHFGYKYKGHNDNIWYAVTQLMIWRESNPNGGDYYFTDTLNGSKTSIYDSRINEINNIINSYDNEIPIENELIKMQKGETKEIEIGDTLNFYITSNEEVKLENGKIIVQDLEEGEYDITLNRIQETIYGTPPIIYQSNNSQNMIMQGDLDPKEISFKLRVIDNHLDIFKIDEDTNDYIPSGEGVLDGAVFQIDKDGEEYDQIEIINGTGSLHNMPLGNYTIKEIKAGEGYELNEEVYSFSFTEDNQGSIFYIPNKVIEKELTIIKYYDDNKKESNIEFQVLKDEELFTKDITNEEGKVTFKLPYGSYTIKQMNTTEGYQLVEPFYISIIDSNNETIELYDYKIPVPNTSKESILVILLKILEFILC